MHKSVLQEESLHYLDIQPDGVYVDLTGGGGGHSKRIADLLSDKGRLIICDRDLSAYENLRKKFAEYQNVVVAHTNFKDFDLVLKDLGIDKIDGILGDFGVSTMQLMEAERGFSFRKDGPLDMRMNVSEGESAADVVNELSREKLAEIIKKYGEEKFAWKIAGVIVERRAEKQFETTADLAQVIAGAIPRKFHKPGINPATKSFQAIRIYVNSELDSISEMLAKLEKYLNVGARAVFISFHSLEDRLVKDAFKEYEKSCVCPPELPICNCDKKKTFKILTKKPVQPGKEELGDNPLSRSAKLRAAMRIED